MTLLSAISARLYGKSSDGERIYQTIADANADEPVDYINDMKERYKKWSHIPMNDYSDVGWWLCRYR